MARAYWCCYYSYLDYMKRLNDEERGQLFTTLLIYARDGVVQESMSDKVGIAFDSIRVQMDRDSAGYDDKCAKLKENISKRWEKKSDTNVYKCIPNDTNEYNCIQKYTNVSKEKEKEKEKDKKKKKDNDIIPLYNIPLIDETTFGVSQEDVDRWKKMYPIVNVEAEIDEIIAWCNKHPDRRKTRSGARRFINNWLGNAQNSGRPINYDTPKINRQSNADTMREMILEGVFND